MFKKWSFLRKLNKEIKPYGAKASIKGCYKYGEIIIKVRKYETRYLLGLLLEEHQTENKVILEIIRQLKILNVKEAYDR